VIRWTPRRRVIAGLIVSAAMGWLWSHTVWPIVQDQVDTILARQNIGCGIDSFFGFHCERRVHDLQTAVTNTVLVAGSVLLTLIGWWLISRWTLRSLRDLRDSVQRMGPQNLTERNNFAGPDDEVRRLADAIDAMLDRVAEGYEGQRRFAANASHELRTPLAVQRTLIEVGMAGRPTSEQLELLSRQLLHTNQRNVDLIEGLLVLAETDRGLMSRTPHSLDDLAGQVSRSFASTAADAGVTLEQHLAPVTVHGEQALLERLIANLVQNGIKYNVAGGRVVVQTLAGPARLVVRNTGQVIPGDQVPALFEPFRRLAPDRLDHSGGAGLGLTIARSIAEAHGAVITATANPDGGLAVTVEFPGRVTRRIG
jgi:signal transduction histidine kinase